MPISALEILVSNLERRGAATGEATVSPRLCDLPATLPAITGKVEMVYEGEQQGAEVVAKKLIGTAVKKLFDAKFPPPDAGRPDRAAPPGVDEDEEPTAGPVATRAPALGAAGREAPSRSTSRSSHGSRPTIGSRSPTRRPSREHLQALEAVPGLKKVVEEHFSAASHEEIALAMELVLEGLTQHLKIAREDLDRAISYKEMLKFNLGRKNSRRN